MTRVVQIIRQRGVKGDPGESAEDAILFTSQTLTAPQQAQARTNIAAQLASANLDRLDGTVEEQRTAIEAAAASHSHTFASLTEKPTTLAGYGIIDGLTEEALIDVFQPIDSDLTAIAGLGTASFGRSLLTQSNAAAARATIEADPAFQPANVAALASLSVIDGQVVNLRGYYAAGDGGGQVLYYDATSTATVNGGTVFNGPSGTGRFLTTAKFDLNVRHFGAKGDGTTNDSSAIQAAIDVVFAQNGGSVYFPAGHYRCNVTVNTGYPNLLYGDGDKTVLQSFSANEFSVKMIGGFQSSRVENIKFAGADNSHGLYVDCGAHFSISDCRFSNCLMGLVTHSTIDTNYRDLFFEFCYVAMTFLSTTAGTTVSQLGDSSPVSYTFPTPFFDIGVHPGEAVLTGVRINTSGVGIWFYQPGITLKSADIKQYGGLVQSCRIGLLLNDIGPTGHSHIPNFNGVWFESNGSGGGTFALNGTTYSDLGFVVQSGGISAFYNCVILDKCVASNNAIVQFHECSVETSASFVTDATSTVLHYGTQATLTALENYNPTAPIPQNQVVFKACKPTNLGNAYVAKSSNPFFDFSSVSFFGAGSATNVNDGVLRRQTCKEVTLPTANNGLILFNTTGFFSGTWSVGRVSLKLVSGEVGIGSVDADSPFTSTSLPGVNTATWTHFVFLRHHKASSSGASYVYLGPGASGAVVRVSASCLMNFGSYEEAIEYINSGEISGDDRSVFYDSSVSFSQPVTSQALLTAQDEITSTKASGFFLSSENNVFHRVKDTGGTYRLLLGRSSDNKTYLVGSIVRLVGGDDPGASTFIEVKASEVQIGGNISVSLPTSNPGAGLLWSDGGTVKVGT